MFGTVFGLIALACAVWVIYEVWMKSSNTTEMKIVWTVCAFLFSVITAIAWFFVGRK